MTKKVEGRNIKIQVSYYRLQTHGDNPFDQDKWKN
jgi:hypothetical protein